MKEQENETSFLSKHSWSTEPEVDENRRKELAKYSSIVPNINQGIYPFKNIKLTRADIEWLIITHKGRSGQMELGNKSLGEDEGLDLRGADLRNIDLSGLSLAYMLGGLTIDRQITMLDYQHDEAAVHLEQANLFSTRLEQAFLTGAHLERANLSEAHLERTLLSEAHLERANLSQAHLERALLNKAHLERAFLNEAHLEGANLFGAQLTNANLFEVHLERANLSGAHLEGANLSEAHLEGANLSGAHLEGANLSEAHLEGANLSGAHLEGANLSEAHLEGKSVPADVVHRVQKWSEHFPLTLPPANLRGAFFDSATNLEGIILGNEKYGFIPSADVHWGSINLAVIDWAQVKMLGDEYEAHQQQQANGRTKDKTTRVNEYRAAVRANRQLAVALQGQGLAEDAARCAYRAQVLQRQVLRRQLGSLHTGQQHMDFWRQVQNLGQRFQKFGSYIFSLFLDGLAGYGYRPARSLFWYLFVIFGFTIAYYLLRQGASPQFSPGGALVFSLTSFHGRGFFPGGINLDSPITRLAAAEAVLGLLIEISFIATFTQRFFGK